MFRDGMSDLFDVVYFSQAKNARGGLSRAGKVTQFTKVLGRFTVKLEREQLIMSAVESIGDREQWNVILELNPQIRDGDQYIILNTGSPQSTVQLNTLYRILRARDQRNEYNVYHHSSLVVEKDASATTAWLALP